MLILYPAVSSLVIIVLKLVCLFCTVGIAPCPVVFKFRQKEQVIRRAGNIACSIGPAACVVAVLCHGFHNGPEVGRQRGKQGIGRGACRGPAVAQQGLSHQAIAPTAAVCVGGIHLEPPGTGGIIRTVVTVTQANILSADFSNLEMDTVAALSTAVMIESNDKRLHRQVGERKVSHPSIDGNCFGITHRPVIRRLSCVACLLDGGPAIAG